MGRRLHLATKATRPEPSPVKALRPDPLLWKVVTRLAGGDLSRVQVLSETEAIVHRPTPERSHR